MINKYNFPIVRIATDVACITTIVSTFAFLQCSSACTQIETVVWINIIANGITVPIQQACDNYITFARYAVALGWNISRERYIITTVFVIVGLYLSWWPFFTLAPFIANMNTDEAFILYISFQW